ncbi:pentatricopeptide repeat-containing protein At2g01390 [Cornus florida]|uniref:pentatricopeptide repeat-containing protein At2g01390 n=1 Tax=Cornus florida TaxID=4283 RepID=UPI002896A243|nr:pentatricopeptide repeat-containing protein At2g01390 [Cornus florida]
MFTSHATLRFLKKYNPILAIYGDKPFGCWNRSSNKGVHSLHQFKQRRTIRQINRRMRKSYKSAEKESLDVKVYTRDTVRNISNILRYSTWDVAQEQLKKLTLRWDSYTINQVLKTHPPMEKAWLFFNWASGLKGFKHDQFTYTTMLDIFGEARRISSMNYVFQQMQEKGIKIDAVTYTSLLHWLSNDGDFDGAAKVWKEMKAKGCHPTVVSYTAYMKVLFDQNRAKEAAEVYKEMLQSGCSPNCYTYTVLMEHLAGSGKYKAALDIFSKMQESGVLPDKATCNILVEKCCKAGETWAMTQILQYMKENFLVLRYPIYLEALETLKIAGESHVLLQQVNPHVSTECIKEETDDFSAATSDVHSTIDRGVILNFLMRKNFVAVDCLLSSMMDKNTPLYSGIISIIIEANSAHCRPSGALLAFEYSLKMGINIERTAYLALIGVFVRTNSFPKVVVVVEEMARAGLYPGTYLGALLIYRLGCARDPVSAAKVFDLLPDDQKNTATYTALIYAYFFSRNGDKGLKVFKAMKNKGIHVALGTYDVLLAGLERSGRIREVELYVKEKKCLQADGHSQDIVPMEEIICNLLFAGDVFS